MIKKLFVTVMVLFLVVGLYGCNNVENSVKEPAVEKVNDVELKDILNEIKIEMNDEFEKESGTNLLEDGKLVNYNEIDLISDDEYAKVMLERIGLNKDNISEGIILLPMMNVKSDEVILLKAKNKSDIDNLKLSLEKELESQLRTWEMYLPEQYEKVKNNKIVVKGNYLLYVTFNNTEEIVDVFKESIK